MSETRAITVGTNGLQLNTIDDMWRFAQCVVNSGLAPKGINKPDMALVAIQMGMEVGLRPMQALQNIAVINGRPTVWGDSAKALIEGSGLCVKFVESFDGKPYDDDFRAVCEVQREKRDVVRWEFSVADAKRAKLWGKSGPWSDYPKRMLQMRARSFAIRDAFPDVLKGLNIAEEVRDYIDVTPDDGEPAPPPEPEQPAIAPTTEPTTRHEKPAINREELYAEIKTLMKKYGLKADDLKEHTLGRSAKELTDEQLAMVPRTLRNTYAAPEELEQPEEKGNGSN